MDSASLTLRTYNSFEELIAEYESGELHPADLKPALSKALNKILEVSCIFLSTCKLVTSVVGSREG